jgi:DCC1-like thiol-disulfide oxidoreductase
LLGTVTWTNGSSAMMKTKRTNTAVVIYDGECAFCRQAVSAIRARDKQDEFMFVSRRTPRIKEEFPQVDFGDFDKGMVLVEPHGERARRRRCNTFYRLKASVFPFVLPGMYRVP